MTKITVISALAALLAGLFGHVELAGLLIVSTAAAGGLHWWRALKTTDAISTEVGRLRLIERSLQQPAPIAKPTHAPLLENQLKHRVARTENALGQVFLEARRLEACLHELSDVSIQTQIAALCVAIESAKSDPDSGAAYYQVAGEGHRLGLESDVIAQAALPVVGHVQRSVSTASEHFMRATAGREANAAELASALELLRQEARLSDQSIKRLVSDHPKVAPAVAPLSNGVVGLQVVLDDLLDAMRQTPSLSA